MGQLDQHLHIVHQHLVQLEEMSETTNFSVIIVNLDPFASSKSPNERQTIPELLELLVNSVNSMDVAKQTKWQPCSLPQSGEPL